MRWTPFGLVVVGALAIAVGGTAARAAPGKGRVVRVERTKAAAAAVPRTCVDVDPATGLAKCWGRPARVGERGTVIDPTGVRATVRVTAVTPLRDTCGEEFGWDIRVEADDGGLDGPRGLLVVVFDWPAGDAARTVPGAPLPDAADPAEMTIAAIDVDADGAADGFATWTYCDGAGTRTFGSTPDNHYCLHHYLRRGHGDPVRVRTDLVSWCQ